MKKIKIEVTLIVPDNFEKNESDWDLENAVNSKYEYYSWYID